MGILGKLAFWKKKDEFEDIGKDLGLDKELGMDTGTGMSPELGFGMETAEPHKYPSFQQPAQPSGYQSYSQPSIQQPSFQQSPPSYHQMSDQEYINSKSLEVISSKLDALKAAIESINHRLANIESIAKGEQEDRRRRYF